MRIIASLSAGLAAAALFAAAVPALADETLTQTTAQNSSGTITDSSLAHNTSLATSNAFEAASGNIGLNQADGQGNMQGNVLYVDGGAPFAFTGVFGQSSSGDSGTTSDTNLTRIDSNAFQHASGRIGVNQASGNGNRGLNAAVIADNSAKTISSAVTQNVSTANMTSSLESNKNYLTDNAFRYASGDIGVNQAAGNLNGQANTLVVGTDTALTLSAQGLTQTSTGNRLTSNAVMMSGNTNYSEVSGYAFEHAQGNIGVNQASGNGNMQANSAVVLK